MNWFIWRQLRKQFLVFAVLLAAFAALLIPTSISYWHSYQSAIATCAQNPALSSCSDLSSSLFTGQFDGFVRIAAVLGTFGLSLLLGLFIGSPLVAKEYEEGTNKLAWTQSVSRRKWLTAKLMWALGFALLYGLLLTLLVTWWSRAVNAAAQNRFVQGHFETQGLMPVAYSVFFTAIGFSMGAWFRKTLLALAMTFGIFVLCAAGFANWIRPHYMAPVTVTAPMGPSALDNKVPSGAWLLKREIVDKNGKAFDSFRLEDMPQSCQTLIQQIRNSQDGGGTAVKVGPGSRIDACLNSAGYHQIAKYQPSYRYWNFQRIEAGIYLGLSVLAVSATYWLVLKRDA